MAGGREGGREGHVDGNMAPKKKMSGTGGGETLSRDEVMRSSC